MKKILVCLCLLFSTPALALNCEAGKMISGLDGTPYCLSNVMMTWWSAFTWCQAQGGTLISLDDCVYEGKSYLSSGKCENLAVGENRPVWTSVAIGTVYAYQVNLSSGEVSGDLFGRNGLRYTLCR